MNHDEYKELLSAFLDGELTDADRADVLAHLETCEACRTYFAELNALRDALGDLADVDVPEGFSDGVLARLHEENMPKPAKKAGVWRKWGALAACAAVVLLAVTTLPRMQTGGGMGASADSAAALEESAYMAANNAPMAPQAAAPMAPDAGACAAESAEDSEDAAPAPEAGAEEKIFAVTTAESPAEAQEYSAAAFERTAGGSADPGEPEAPTLPPALLLYGEGAEEWLAANGEWSAEDAAYRVDNEALELLPDGLTLQDADAADENGMWHLVRAAETEAAP